MTHADHPDLRHTRYAVTLGVSVQNGGSGAAREPAVSYGTLLGRCGQHDADTAEQASGRLVRVIVILIVGCRSVLTERCCKIAR